MSVLVAVEGALPPHRYRQAQITDAFIDANDFDDQQVALTRRFHASSQVEHRYLAYPIETYTDFNDFTTTNDAYIAAALELGEAAIRSALSCAGLQPHDVDIILTTSVTGLAVPSLDSRLASRLGLRDDITRLPLFGLGCAGGAGGIARMHDQLLAWPDRVAVLLAVEVCSLTTQRGDASMPHLVASALFGDGAAAVVAVGEQHPLARADSDAASASRRPRVIATASRLYPDTERAMGWDIGSWGLRIVLDAQVPDLVETHLRSDVEEFLGRYELKLDDIDTWVCHPGGPKVLEAVQTALDLPREAVELTWKSLADIGNLSSASVLHVLHHTLLTTTPAAGSYGLLVSMGPGFAAELVLLQW